MKYAIVGTGPSALATALALNNSQNQVDVFDSWIELDQIKNANLLYPELELKTRFGTDLMYKSPSNSINLNLSSRPISSVFGGLSTVWGAGVSEDYLQTLSQFSANEVKDALLEIKRHMPISRESHPISRRLEKLTKDFKSSHYSINPSDLAYYPEKCARSGMCMVGCKESAIWSTIPIWRNILLNPNFQKITGIVEYINGNIVKIMECDNRLYGPYDHIFIGAGPISSSHIMQKSKLYPEVVYLEETSIKYNPIVTFQKYSKTNFNLAQVFIKSRKNHNFWMSVYESSDFISEKIQKIFNKFKMELPNLLIKRILVGISYSDSLRSPKIEIAFKNNTSYVHGIKQSKKKIEFESLSLVFELLKCGFIFFPFLARSGKPGASYHIGKVSDHEGDFLLDHLGRVVLNQKISIVDSSALRNLPRGPITLLTMVNAYSITMRVLKANQQNNQNKSV